MLNIRVIEHILGRLPELRIGVVGDLFLDRYFDLDARLTERSVETGLEAYQAVRVRSAPGAAGTIVNNLAAMDVGGVSIISVIGRDAEGFELKQHLARRRVNTTFLVESEALPTPTYMKPMLFAPPAAEAGESSGRELNRIDLRSREPLPGAVEVELICRLVQLMFDVDALLVSDQIAEANRGVVTPRVRKVLTAQAHAYPRKFILADSRSRIDRFEGVALKPNHREWPETSVRELAARSGKPVFCTRGERGILLYDQSRNELIDLPAYPVAGPVDPVGAGDSCAAGIACAVAAGASLSQAAAFGNLVASITVAQLGTTGVATPEMIRRRWAEVGSPDAR